MSNIAMQGGATGTGTVTLLAPSTSTNRILTLPDAAGTVTTSEAVAAAGYTTPAAVLTQFNASGSAPVYACRAWVNFNGTGTVAIRASGNVSSITDNATGDYTVNFTTAMPDANFSAAGTAGTGSTANASFLSGPNNQVPAVGSFRVLTLNATVATDYAYVSLSFFR